MKEKNPLGLLIEAAYDDLRPSEKKAADFILKRMPEIDKITLEKMAALCGVSQPTIMRLLHAIGFRGYREFQFAVVQENARISDENAGRGAQVMYGYWLSDCDRMEDIPAKIAGITSEMIGKSLKSISAKTLRAAVERLKSAKRIELYGVENSGAVVRDLAAKLLYLGMNCCFFEDAYLQRISAETLGEGDVAVAVSYSGQSRETVDAVRAAKKKGAATIVITNFKDSLIGRYADFLICTSQEQLFYGDTIFSRTTQMMVIDMIYAGIISSDFKKYAKYLDDSQRLLRDRAYER